MQLALVGVIALVSFVVSGQLAASSALIGGSLFVFPQLYFGYKAFQIRGASQIHRIVANFYRGESTKLLVIACGFAVVFKFVQPLHHGVLFGTFIAMVVVNCFSPLLADYLETHSSHKTKP